MSPIDIKVLSTTAMKTVFEELAPAFERATGNRLSVTLGPSLRLEKQLDLNAVPVTHPVDVVGMHVLIVDNNATNRRILNEQFDAW